MQFPNVKFCNYIKSRSKPWPMSYGPQHEKNCLWGFVNSTGADQPAHLHSLISTFVIRFLESIVCELAHVKFQFSS